MMKQLFTVTLVFATLACMCIPSYAFNPPDVPSNYSGWAGMDVPFDIGSNFINQAATIFFKSEGRWPYNWAEVREYGIIQTELIAPGGQMIDPDDRSLDFLWDVTYSYTPGDNAPVVTCLFDLDQPSGSSDVLEIPNTSLDDLLIAYDQATYQLYDFPQKYSATWIYNDRNARRLTAAMLMANISLQLYMLHTNKRLSSVDEYLSSGWNTFDANSVNPCTGGQILTDGSAYNFRWSPEGKQFTLVNAEGVSILDIL